MTTTPIARHSNPVVATSSTASGGHMYQKRRQRQRQGRLRLLFVGLVVVAAVGYAILSSSLMMTTQQQLYIPNDDTHHHHHSLSSSSSIHTIPKIITHICQDPAVSYLQVSPIPASSSSTAANPKSAHLPPSSSKSTNPTILCIVLTQSSNHATRLRAIYETWGRKCTGFVAASNIDDPQWGAVHIPSMPGYWGIWDKLMQTIRLVMNQNISIVDRTRNDHDSTRTTIWNATSSLHPPSTTTFDWIVKADDDTYMIMENLIAFLIDQQHQGMDTTNLPLIYGRIMPWPKIKQFTLFPGWFTSKRNKAFGERFLKVYDVNHTLHYAHGGPGYTMNWKYAHTLYRAYFHSKNNVKGKISEDLANAVTMLYRNITPHSTIDITSQQERSHPESPHTMYENPQWLPWLQSNIQHLGKGNQCCSPTSISFHHVSEHAMRTLEYQLYTCPKLLSSSQ